MSETTKQPVEAAGLLSKLAELFFKGLDGLLSSTAEYEEEYGVLKQVNRIAVTDDDNNDYTLTIKLSPIKEKNNMFYVEASIDPPGIDVSSLDKKVVSLSKNTKSKFNDMINKFLQNNSLYMKEDNEEVYDEEKTDNKAEEVQELIDDTIDELRKTDSIVIDKDGNEYLIDTELEYNTDREVIEDTMHILDAEGHRVNTYPTVKNQIRIIGENGETLTSDVLWDILVQHATKYAKTCKLAIFKDQGLFGSTQLTHIKATFVKSTDSNQIELRAISATSDLDKAMSAIYDVANDDDFVNMLSAEPQSFEIIDLSNGYDVNPIDGFDTCCVVRSF